MHGLLCQSGIVLERDSPILGYVCGRDAILLGLLCILGPMVPITGLFFHVPTVLSDRAMYLPIVGFALLAGAGTANISVVWCRCSTYLFVSFCFSAAHVWFAFHERHSARQGVGWCS
jgi:hypothetical protein